jgi:hypothetical protein
MIESATGYAVTLLACVGFAQALATVLWLAAVLQARLSPRGTFSQG